MNLFNKIENKPILQILILAAAVFALFGTCVTNEVLEVDDVGMINSLRHKVDWSLKNWLFPEHRGGLYYRPVIGLTFYIDRFIFDLTSFWMHFQNILWHLGNVLLVFGLSRTIVHQLKLSQWFPFLAALFFAVHPLSTESVNWISGRTDLVAGFFVLLSAWCLLLFRFKRQVLWLLVSAAAFMLSILTKEVTLAFVPGAMLLLLVRQDSTHKRSLEELKQFWRNLGVASVFMLAAGVFFWFRFLGISTNNSQIGNTLRLLQNDFFYNVMVVLRAFGFYLKKLALPWPLNFSIMEVDPVYELFAIPLLIAVVILVLVKWDILSGLFAAGLCLFAPAFLIAFGQIAWTPYAERYLYITTAFIALPVVVWMSDLTMIVSARNFRPVWVLLPILIVSFSVTTVHRNLTWKTNYSIFSDTVEKEPYSFSARLVLGKILSRQGDLEKAEEHFQFAKVLDQLWFDERPDVELSKIRVRQGRFEEAYELYLRVITRTQGRSVVVWQNVEDVLKKYPGQTAMIKETLYTPGIEWVDEYEQPELAHGMASLAIRFGHPDVARGYLDKVLAWAEKSRVEEMLIQDVNKMLEKLDSEERSR